jgi:hypothetical protein
MNCQRSLLLLTVPLLLLLAGCQGSDDITHYQVPRPKPREKERLLGAIIPQQDGSNWFFKFVAPVSISAEYQQGFNDLVRSLRPGEKRDDPLTWKLPEGWVQTPGNENRFATLRFGPEQSLELSISRFGGSLLANANRWLGEMGQPDAPTERELREQKVIEDLQVHGLRVVLVDITGSADGRGRRGMMGKAPPRGPAEKAVEPKYDVPDGWKQAPPPNSTVKVAFRLPDGQDKSPEVTITPLRGEGGGLLEDYRRWQTQLGLKPATELPKDLKTIKSAGQDAVSVDLLGPEGKDQKRTLVVLVKHQGFTWYFKLMAASDVVARNQAAFEAFVKSVRF